MGRFWQKIKTAWLDAWEEVERNNAATTQAQNLTLMEKIEASDEHPWSEAEMNIWIDSLDSDLRRRVLASAKKVAMSGEDPVDFLCKLRVKIDAQQQQAEEEERANRPTIGGLLWAWDEARLMGAQREFFDRENRKARGR